jgi:Holliday junction resolvasome RuvABC DNA-binding subunit
MIDTTNYPPKVQEAIKHLERMFRHFTRFYLGEFCNSFEDLKTHTEGKLVAYEDALLSLGYTQENLNAIISEIQINIKNQVKPTK